MSESFVLADQWVPRHACKHHLDIVSKKLAPIYGCSAHSVVGMMLLEVSSVIAQDDCPYHKCDEREDFSVRRGLVRSES